MKLRLRLKKHPERNDVVGTRPQDKDMKAAHEQARATIYDLIEAVQNPEEGKRYLVEVRLSEGKAVEHVWLEPVNWINPGLAGVLAVDPVIIKKHKIGDIIKPLPREISDWAILSPDGSKEGGFTMDTIDRLRKTENAQRTSGWSR